MDRRQSDCPDKYVIYNDPARSLYQKVSHLLLQLDNLKNILFICAKNLIRNPSAEAVFSDVAGVATASAGVNHDADIRVSPELIDWADIIFAMEAIRRSKLRNRYRSALNGKKVICLDIPDDFEYMQPSLVDLLRRKVAPYLPR